MQKRISKFQSASTRLGRRRGDIWVETIIYTLIALTMMGAVLAFIIPKIGEFQDKSTIEQSVNLMKDMNNVILSVVQGGPGNKRIVDAEIKKGAVIIDGTNNKISFQMETDYLYSEPGREISMGSIKATTEKLGGTNKVTLTMNYAHEISVNGKNEEKRIEHSANSYKISIENKGEDAGGKTVIDFVVS